MEHYHGNHEVGSVLCGASAYEQKYFFNEQYATLPSSIQEELRIICTLFTEDAGGIFTISFSPEGEIILTTDADEEDILYDEISGGLLVRALQRKKEDLFASLEMYYRVFVLKEGSLADDLGGK